LTDNQLAHEFGKSVLIATITAVNSNSRQDFENTKSADGNINTPHGGKTADAAESEGDDGSSKLIAKES
jgi:hypothetical protein